MIGALIIDKPEGMTSHTVVARVRRATGIRKVGHTGTLDPFATGVLVVCVGRATRLAQFLVDLDKEYLATVRLGFSTDTQDLTGKQITPLKSSNESKPQDVRRVLNEFRGPQLQLPPMFSAKKIAGERLYRAAREGREVEREPAPINIYSIELIESVGPPLRPNEDGTQDFTIRVRCSSGTYVRTLAHDIGRKLGVGAHLAALRRTGVGSFDISGAITLDEVASRANEGTLEEVMIEPADMLAHKPLVRLDAGRVRRVMNGQAIELTASEIEVLGMEERPARMCDEGGALVAVGWYEKNRKMMRPRVVMAGSE
ncbi:MAG: tRNA pseudouridine(55) synthase TruB [Blastocatellia bacterium]|nr:tRNA pseudouridine(55) synthase TruB [Blastocatellia bacterium]